MTGAPGAGTASALPAHDPQVALAPYPVPTLPAESPDDFSQWYAACMPRIVRALTLAVGDAGLAEEAAAEAFARALVHWRSVRHDRRERWVFQVALNQVRSRFRRHRLEQRWAQRQQIVHQAPPADPDTALWTAVAQLPPRARTAVALRYVADLSEAEVAQAMGIARGTVAATLHKARHRLSQLLADQAPPSSTRGTP
jgi:RNA polymerase sigma-70 factor (ECF subfamily)